MLGHATGIGSSAHWRGFSARFQRIVGLVLDRAITDGPNRPVERVLRAASVVTARWLSKCNSLDPAGSASPGPTPHGHRRTLEWGSALLQAALTQGDGL